MRRLGTAARGYESEIMRRWLAARLRACGVDVHDEALDIADLMTARKLRSVPDVIRLDDTDMLDIARQLSLHETRSLPATAPARSAQVPDRMRNVVPWRA